MGARSQHRDPENPSRSASRHPPLSRGGPVAITVLLLIVAVVCVPVRREATQRDGNPATAAIGDSGLQYVLVTTAFRPPTPYSVLDGERSGPVRERGTVRWAIDWFLWGITGGCILLLGIMGTMILTDPAASDRPAR